MKLDQLRYLEAVIRTRSFHRAAISMRVSQPTVSQQIRALEREFGVPLVVRLRSGVVPTDAGTIVHRYALSFLGLEESLLQEVRRTQQIEIGRVRLAAITAATDSFLHTALIHLRREHPGLSLHVVESASRDVERQLLEGHIDLGIVWGLKGRDWSNPEARDLEYRNLLTSPFVVCVPANHSLLERTVIEPEMVASLPLVVYSPRLSLYNAAFDFLGVSSHEPAFTVSSLQTAILLVQAGLGVAIVPALAMLGGVAPQVGVEYRAFRNSTSLSAAAVRRAGGHVTPATAVALGALEEAAKEAQQEQGKLLKRLGSGQDSSR